MNSIQYADKLLLQKSNIVFAIKIPVVIPNSFQYLHIYPLPTDEKSKIITKKTIMTLELQKDHHMELHCKRIQLDFLCHHEELNHPDPSQCNLAAHLNYSNELLNCTQVSIKQPLQYQIKSITNIYVYLLMEKSRIQIQ